MPSIPTKTILAPSNAGNGNKLNTAKFTAINGNKTKTKQIQKWLKENSGKTYKDSIDAYYKILEEKKNNKIRIIEIKIEKEADSYREIVENIDGELPIYFYCFKRNVELEPSKKLFFNKKGLNNEYEEREELCLDMKSFDEECKYALFADILDLEADDRFNFISIMLNKKGFIVNNCLLCGYMRYDSLWKKEFCEKYRIEKNTCYKNKKYER